MNNPTVNLANLINQNLPFSSETLNNINIPQSTFAMDTGRYGSALVSSRIFANKSLEDSEWIKITFLTLLGFGIYSIVVANIFDINKIKQKNFRLAVDDLLKFGIMLVTLRLFSGDPLIDTNWILGSSFILIGLVIYDFGTIHMVDTEKLHKLNKITNETRKALDDTIKFSTMFIISGFLTEQFNSTNQFLTKEWILECIGFIVGIVAYDYLLSKYFGDI